MNDMASVVSSNSCPALKQLLANPHAFGDINERRAFLRDALKLARSSPSGYTFCSLCRQLAKLSFQVGDKEDGIHNLVESHAVLLRHKALIKYHRTIGKSPNNVSVINKKYIDFFEEPGYDSLLKRLQEMPEEWTIIQLSCAVDATWRFGGPNAEKWTPQLHIVRMECGSKPEFEPLHLKLDPPPEANNFVILKEIREMIKKNDTDHLRESKDEFWKARAHVDSILANIIDYMNTKWFASVLPFLAGHLSDDKMRKTVKHRVEIIASKIASELGTTLSDENMCLLLKLAENFDFISDVSLHSTFARVTNSPKDSPVVKKIRKEFDSLKKDFASTLKSIKREPVLLIVDEKLECLPFEQLEILEKHPVTRIPSLHAVHGLYTVHRSSIENGLKVVDSNSGFYMINPGEDLKDMEGRMSKFLIPRVPKWKGQRGQQLSGDGWSEALCENDIYVYMGHGNGGQYWNVDQLTGGIRSMSLLFGCQSAGYKILRGCVEVDATLQAYIAAACPTLVGLLWNVTDKDTDLLAQAILNLCLPKYSEMSENNGKTGIERRDKKKAVPGASAESTAVPAAEPEIARAVILARAAPKMLITRAGVVVRGLPARIK